MLCPCHPEHNRRIFPFFIFNSISAWQFSECQASVNAGFRPRTATIFLCCQRKMAKETSARAPSLGQPLSVLQPTKQLTSERLPPAISPPFKQVLSPDGSCRAWATSEPGASAWPPLVISLARCYIAALRPHSFVANHVS